MNYILLTLVLNLLQSQHCTIKPVIIAEDNKSYFAPCKYKDGLVFTSNYMASKGCPEKTRLYFSKIISGEQLSTPSTIKVKRYADMEFGVMDILPSTNEVFLTITDPFGDESTKPINLGICTGVMENGIIKDLKIISFCEPGVMSCHPTISGDGKLLIFSSKMEGQEHVQLYQSTRNTINSEWSEPTPIEALAADGNCLFPNLINDSLLVFSSWMSGGKGGMDFYSSKKTAGKWSQPENWAALNSDWDEVGLEMVDEKTGYFSSCRGGGADKLYYFVLED